MLFNSHVFIFAFLPLALGGAWAARRFAGSRAATAWALLASLVFYGWWNPVYLPLLLASIACNFALGRAVAARRGHHKPWLVGGIVVNLAALGGFKYAGFLVGNVDAALGLGWTVPHVVLPLAISFFTFQQIAYLVDVGRGAEAERDPLTYAVFVAFFPQLIAGPIVQGTEMLPQLRSPDAFTFRASDVAVGVSLFLCGLFEKVVLADGVAVYANPVFEAAARGVPMTLFESWGGALAYTYQVYFDFAGYSTMAVGLGRLCGLRLPANFDTPYQATSIIDFWRRWHMTLSRFLKTYLYFPLGGSRVSRPRVYLNLMITMVLGGFWHGAGWGFVVWGALHGVFLCANVLWRRWRARRFPAAPVGRAEVLAGWGLTFALVVLARVYFRADSLAAAHGLLAGAFGAHGAVLDERLAGLLGGVLPGVTFSGVHAGYFNLYGVPWLVALSLVCWFAPGPLELFQRYGAALGPEGGEFRRERRWAPSWAPTGRWALAIAVAGFVAITFMARVTEFIYYQF
ncbi:MBOAT family protein [bacterium]|nr:MBOAT family protein [bacterium]